MPHVAYLRRPLSIIMPIRRSLSALKGAPLSTWWRIDIRLKVRESAWTSLVLFDLRTRSMTQSCVPRICVRCTTAGGPRCQKLLYPRKRRPADTNSDAGITLDASTGLALKKAVAPGPDWLLCLAFSKPLVYFSPFGSPCPAGVSSRGAASEMRRTCHTVPDLPVTPIYNGLCWSLWFRRHVLVALQQSTALRYPGVLV